MSDSATAMRSTAAHAARLLRPDLATRRKRRARFQRSFRQCGDRGGRGRRIVALDRRDQPPAHPHQRHRRACDRRGARHRRRDRRACHRRAEDRRRDQADPQHRRADQFAGAQRDHRSGARRRGRARASRWSHPKSNRWRCRPPRRPRKSPATSSAVQNSTAGAVEAIRQIATRMQEINSIPPRSPLRSSSRIRRPAKSRTTWRAPRKAPAKSWRCWARSPARRPKRVLRRKSCATRRRSAEAAVANLRLEVEDFLAKVAV